MRQLTLNFQNDTEPSGGMRTLSLPEGSRSRASRSRSQESGEAQKTIATCGPRCSTLFGLFDPAGSWARTFTESLIGRKGWSSNRCALTWRRQDTRCSRTLFRLAVSALPTVGTDVGLSPTPTAIDAGSGRMNKSLSPNASERPTLAMASKMGLLPTPTANDAKNVTLPASQGIRNGLPKTAMQSDEYRTGTGSRLNPLYVAEMMGFPGNWLVSPFLGGAGKPSKPAVTP